MAVGEGLEAGGMPCGDVLSGSHSAAVDCRRVKVLGQLICCRDSTTWRTPAAVSACLLGLYQGHSPRRYCSRVESDDTIKPSAYYRSRSSDGSRVCLLSSSAALFPSAPVLLTPRGWDALYLLPVQ